MKEFQYGATAPSLQRARDITVDAIDDFKSGKLDEIYLIYTKIRTRSPVSRLVERLLPLDREHLQPAPKGLGDPPAARWSWCPMLGQCSSRPRPSICTA